MATVERGERRACVKGKTNLAVSCFPYAFPRYLWLRNGILGQVDLRPDQQRKFYVLVFPPERLPLVNRRKDFLSKTPSAAARRRGEELLGKLVICCAPRSPISGSACQTGRQLSGGGQGGSRGRERSKDGASLLKARYSSRA